MCLSDVKLYYVPDVQVPLWESSVSIQLRREERKEEKCLRQELQGNQFVVVFKKEESRNG